MGPTTIPGSQNGGGPFPLDPGIKRDQPHETAMAITPRLAFCTTIMTCVYLGLAILGWGSFAAFFSHPALISLAIVVFGLTGVALLSEGNLSSGVTARIVRTRWVLPAFGLIGLLSAYLPAYADRKEFWTLDGESIRWLGVVLFAAGGALRMWPVFVLGRRFSGLVAIQPGHTLGHHRYLRHDPQPQLSRDAVNYVGWGLAFRSGVGLLLTALLIPPLVVRIRSEKGCFTSTFGQQYTTPTARGRHG